MSDDKVPLKVCVEVPHNDKYTCFIPLYIEYKLTEDSLREVIRIALTEALESLDKILN